MIFADTLPTKNDTKYVKRAAQSEGAKFWLHVLTDLKESGVRDIFIGCIDGLKGFPEAMEAVFPATQVQLCLVHMVRPCLELCGLEGKQSGGG